jgi:outer membrane protein
MRKIVSALALALAVGPASAAEPRIGIVDMERAVNEVDEGKAMVAALEKDLDEKRKQLGAKESEFNALMADFDKQSLVLSEQAKKEKRDDLQRRFQELQMLREKLEKEFMKRQQESSGAILGRMGQIVREIAEADGLTVVLNRSGGAVVYALPSLDVTNELIRKYNARFGAGTAKKAEPGAAAPKKGAPPAKKDASAGKKEAAKKADAAPPAAEAPRVDAPAAQK